VSYGKGPRDDVCKSGLTDLLHTFKT